MSLHAEHPETDDEKCHEDASENENGDGTALGDAGARSPSKRWLACGGLGTVRNSHRPIDRSTTRSTKVLPLGNFVTILTSRHRSLSSLIDDGIFVHCRFLGCCSRE